MQNQSKHEITFDTQLKTALPPPRAQIFMLQKVETASTFSNMKICCATWWYKYGQQTMAACNTTFVARQFARKCSWCYLTFKGLLYSILGLVLVSNVCVYTKCENLSQSSTAVLTMMHFIDQHKLLQQSLEFYALLNSCS